MEDGGGTGWGDHLPPPQMYQNITCTWNNFHRTSSEHWQRIPESQEGKLNSPKWGRAKDKDKKGDKGFWESILRRGSWRKRSFQVTRNPLTGGVIGELRNLRWKHNNAKRRKFCTEVVPNCTAKKQLTHFHLPAAGGGWVWRLWLWGLVLRESTGAECCEYTPRGLMWHSTAGQGKLWDH